MRMRVLLCLIICLLALAGCSHHGSAQVTFHKTSLPETRGNVFESFPAAYITSHHDGEYDILLVNDTLRSASAPRRKKPLRPIHDPPLQQAIHIHVFWRPTNGAMVRETSITNAIVHWYVFSPDSSKGSDMLHYQGAAFVKLSTKGDISNIIIGDGEIAPKDARGELRDPIGHSRITGYVTAVKNDARVRELLNSLQDKLEGNDRYWTEARSEQGVPLGR